MADRDIDKKLLEALFDGICCVDADRKITYWSKGAEAITGLKAKAVMGKRCDDVGLHADAAGRRPCGAACPADKVTADGNPREVEVYMRHRKGGLVPVCLRVAPVPAAEGKMAMAFDVFTEHSPRYVLRKRLEDLRRTMLQDSVTSLGNRRFLESAIGSRLEEMARYRQPFGLIVFDVDDYDHLGSRYGSSAAELALGTVARAMKKCLRSFDVMGRWGGGKFVAIVVNVDQEQLQAISDRFRRIVERMPIPGNGGTFRVSVSSGATLAGSSDTVSRLLQRAGRLATRSRAPSQRSMPGIPRPASPD